MNETHNIVENAIREYERISGLDCRKSVNVKCIAKFLDEINNELKIITIERYNIIEELNRVIQSSKGMFVLIRTDKMKLVIKGEIQNVRIILCYGKNLP